MFYHNFVDLCNKIGKSPSAAAEDMGFKRSVVTRWSKGTAPRQATLQRIADYFGVSVSDLVSEQKENPTVSGEVDIKAWLNGRSDSELLKIIAEATRMMQEKK